MTIHARTPIPELPSNFLARKQIELRLLDASADQPHPAPTLDGIFETKLRAAGQLKAKFNVEHTELTETRRNDAPAENGPFYFDYTYQRADLEVTGPAVGGSTGGTGTYETRYTNSGIAALAAVLTAARGLGFASIATTPGHYPETAELAELLGVTLTTSEAAAAPVALLDSAAPSTRRWLSLVQSARLVIFDTSCYAATSARIRKWVNIARACAPVVLIRSHAKLDTLGVEYGRLGSATVIPSATGRGNDVVASLEQAIIDAIRLTGAAPAPINFPPFIGASGYTTATRQRMAQILRNSRIAFRILSQHGVDVQRFQHGLYLTAHIPGFTTREEVEALAETIAERLHREALPVRHAGSFGFDFVALEWFCQAGAHEAVLRIASGDVPADIMERVARCLSRLLRSAATMHRTLPIMPADRPALSDEERVRLAALPLPHYAQR